MTRGLAAYGMTEALRARFAGPLGEGLEFARVTAVDRNDLVVETDAGAIRAEPTGRMRFVSQEAPVVGDWVAARVVDPGRFAVVERVLPRQSTLARRHPGRAAARQVMAANVDTALIVHSLERAVHVRRLERYLVLSRDGGVEPVILLSKADTVPEDALRRAVAEAREMAETVAISSLRAGGLDELRSRLLARRTYALLGPSGAGKSTLVNALLGSDVQATTAVRETDARGRHTTARRQLMRLPWGALVIDTPGLREVGMTGVRGGLDGTFGDLEELASGCHFRDCGHEGEAGCAVLSAVASGEVEQGRYEHWMKLRREAAHYERSDAEKRRRDREFGKMARAVMKAKKHRR